MSDIQWLLRPAPCVPAGEAGRVAGARWQRGLAAKPRGPDPAEGSIKSALARRGRAAPWCIAGRAHPFACSNDLSPPFFWRPRGTPGRRRGPGLRRLVLGTRSRWRGRGVCPTDLPAGTSHRQRGRRGVHRQGCRPRPHHDAVWRCLRACSLNVRTLKISAFGRSQPDLYPAATDLKPIVPGTREPCAYNHGSASSPLRPQGRGSHAHCRSEPCPSGPLAPGPWETRDCPHRLPCVPVARVPRRPSPRNGASAARHSSRTAALIFASSSGGRMASPCSLRACSAASYSTSHRRWGR